MEKLLRFRNNIKPAIRRVEFHSQFCCLIRKKIIYVCLQLSCQERRDTATLEDSLAISYKTKHTVSIGSSNCAFWYLPKKVENLCPHKTYTWVFIAALFINCQNLETIKMSPSVDERINKLWYIQTK